MPSFKPIHTKYHKLIGARLLLDIGGNAATPFLDNCFHREKFETMVEAAKHLPRYIIYDDLVEMLYDKDGAMQKSLSTMIEADVGHLPFEQVLVEFDEPAEIKGYETFTTRVRHFIYLSEDTKAKREERFTSFCFSYVEATDTICISPICAAATMVTEEQARIQSQKTGLQILGEGGSGVIFRATMAPYMNKEKLTYDQMSKIIDISLEHSLMPVTRALCALIVLLQTKGVDREVISVNPKLNKERGKSGKPHIQDHTVIRVGHTYNREGERVKYISNRKMPVHWRAGHIRNQRFGVGLKQSYQLWIAPMLINYVENEPIPVPKIKEITQ